MSEISAMILIWGLGILFSVMNILSVVFLVLYMNKTAKLKNQELGVGWYLGAFFFTLITAIVFISKSKNFPGETTKVCYQCGDRYPENFTMCTRCLIDLPVINKTHKENQRKSAKHFGAAFWVVMTISIIAVVSVIGVGVYLGIQTAEDIIGCGDRIGIENEAGEIVYYDKMGNSYEVASDVLLYDEKGEVYTYVIKDVDDGDGYVYQDWFYVDSKGKEYEMYDCYVTADGWFYYDEECELYMDYSDVEDIEEEYPDDYGIMDALSELQSEMDSYRYYDDVYLDEEGNIYYYAETVSWNEKGEIITAENDPNPVAK